LLREVELLGFFLEAGFLGEVEELFEFARDLAAVGEGDRSVGILIVLSSIVG
jgi:hypothetical protein